MRDVDYAILEKRISRLERLIANEQLDQKNEFLGLGKKKVGSRSGEQVLEVFNEEPIFDQWKKDRLTSGWKDNSSYGTINLSLDLIGHPRIGYTVTLYGMDLKKVKLEIRRGSRGLPGVTGDVLLSEVVSLAKPAQIKKVANRIIDHIDQMDFI